MAKGLLNTPVVKLGLVGVSRDCFPVALTERRLDALAAALKKKGVQVHRCRTVIENESGALAALIELEQKNVNAVAAYLGNFGPEGPTSLFLQRFAGPAMVCAAAEEDKAVLARDRGDALCGLLSLSYNLGLRRRRVYVPERPVGLPGELADEIADFAAVARVVIGVKGLKLFGFGPRPQDFYACHAPLQPLFDLGVEVMENSELDLFKVFREAAGRKEKIKAVARDMAKELGPGNVYPDLLPRLAQFEVGLMDFMSDNLGASRFAAFANKCWPAFESEFGFVPCYVNARLAGRGIPVACEVDFNGAVSEYMVQLATLAPATILDVNNTVPADLIPKSADLKDAQPKDLFMGFHCGNTASSCLATACMNYQVIMNRLMEDGHEPNITRGTLEGRLRPGPMTLFRLQAAAEGALRAYLAEGEILDLEPATFGSTGVIAIPGFARFYRHVLIAKNFPHHAAVGFARAGKALFAAARLLGVDEVDAPRAESAPYPGENPFARGD